MLPPVPLDPSTRNSAEIEISLTETSGQSSMVEVDKVTVAPDLSIAPEVLVAEPNSSVAVVQPLINLKEEPVATNTKEEPKAAANS